MGYSVIVYDDVTAWHSNTIIFYDPNHTGGRHQGGDDAFISISNNIITRMGKATPISGRLYTITFEAKKVIDMPVGGVYLNGTITIGSGGACDANVFFAVAEEGPQIIPKAEPKPEPEADPKTDPNK